MYPLSARWWWWTTHEVWVVPVEESRGGKIQCPKINPICELIPFNGIRFKCPCIYTLFHSPPLQLLLHLLNDGTPDGLTGIKPKHTHLTECSVTPYLYFYILISSPIVDAITFRLPKYWMSGRDSKTIARMRAFKIYGLWFHSPWTAATARPQS